MTSLVNGAKETEEFENELYCVTKGVVYIQLMFFLIKLLREFQTQKLKSSAQSLHTQEQTQVEMMSQGNFTMGQNQLGAGLVDNFQPIQEQLSETHYNSNGAPNQAIEFIN